MKDDMISREAAIEFAKEQMEKETGMYSKGRNAGLRVMISALNNPDAIPSVPAVPIEPLARFIVENLDPRVDCESCVSDVENADRDCRNFPRMSEEQVLDALEKWMEEQNEG